MRPSASAPESPPCPRCTGAMKLVQITPKFAWLPELKTFQCSSCKEVITVSQEDERPLEPHA
jgi:hypothetical protein